MKAHVSAPRFLLAALVILAGLSSCASRAPQPADQPSSQAAISRATTPADRSSVEWWFPRHEEKLAARHSNIELVMIGDSITHSWEKSGRTVWESHFSGIDALNLGFSGDRTENVLWRLEHGEVEGLSPDLVVMMIGTNNTGHRMDPPEAIAAGVAAILDELATRLPGSPVLLLAIFPRGETPGDPMRVNNDETNRLLEGLADEVGVEFADINQSFLADGAILERTVMPDLLHPNADGYEIWAEQLAPWFEKYLESR